MTATMYDDPPKCPYCKASGPNPWEEFVFPIEEFDDEVRVHCDNCGRHFMLEVQVSHTFRSACSQEYEYDGTPIPETDCQFTGPYVITDKGVFGRTCVRCGTLRTGLHHLNLPSPLAQRILALRVAYSESAILREFLGFINTASIALGVTRDEANKAFTELEKLGLVEVVYNELTAPNGGIIWVSADGDTLGTFVRDYGVLTDE